MTQDMAQGEYVSKGEFTRDQRYIATRITADGRDGYPVEPGRYRLVVSRACPWANRAIIVRRLLGLEDVLSMGICGPTHDERSWTFDLDPGGRDPVLGIERLQEAYFARFPGYDRGITVPAIVDVPTGQVVTNDFAQITLDLSTEWTAVPPRRARRDLYPRAAAGRDRRGQRAWSSPTSTTASTGAGSPARQEAYEQAYRAAVRPAGLAVASGWPTSATWSATRSPRPTCGCSPRWSGSTPVYHGHFKCNRQKLTEMPVLWAYARDLFQTPGLRRHRRLRPHQAALLRGAPRHQPDRHRAAGPDLSNWLDPHGREALGGRPFGDGTPPPPPTPTETIPPTHTA